MYLKDYNKNFVLDHKEQNKIKDSYRKISSENQERRIERNE